MIPFPSTCGPCVLNHKLGYSQLEGDGSSGLMVIAEALGRKEEIAGLPLRESAPAGGVFQKAVDASGLSRNVMTLTNILRCRPPGNELRGMPYEREAIDNCRQYLDAAVAERRPSLILALGDIPLRELSLAVGAISELRGYVLPSRYEGIPLIATYHPSHLARGAMHLFGVFLHDIRRAHQYATHGVPAPLPTQYQLTPSLDDVRAYLRRLEADASLNVAYDIETEEILGLPGPVEWRDKEIIQIQFSSGVGEAIVLPYEGDYRLLSHRVLATPNLKWGWNSRLSDNLALRGDGAILGGELHDLMVAWGHLQPNFMSSKDDAHGDKGVPARLMSLQSCVSFYYPYESPWKGMVGKALTSPYDIGTEEWHEWMSLNVWPVLRWYGARDADLTYRVGTKLFASLHKLGLW